MKSKLKRDEEQLIVIKGQLTVKLTPTNSK